MHIPQKSFKGDHFPTQILLSKSNLKRDTITAHKIKSKFISDLWQYIFFTHMYM